LNKSLDKISHAFMLAANFATTRADFRAVRIFRISTITSIVPFSEFGRFTALPTNESPSYKLGSARISQIKNNFLDLNKYFYYL